jgi:hypothetical protein
MASLRMIVPEGKGSYDVRADGEKVAARHAEFSVNDHGEFVLDNSRSLAVARSDEKPGYRRLTLAAGGVTFELELKNENVEDDS